MSELALELIEKERKEKTGKLDLGRCGLKTIPKEVFELTWLEELSFISFYYDYDLDQYVHSTNFGDTNFIEDKILSKDFRHLKGLKKLFLGNKYTDEYKIKNYDILTTLTSLVSLTLYNIEDFTFLGVLNNLKHLILTGINVNDLSKLENLTELRSLEIQGNNFSDISFLEKIIDLEVLLISSKKDPDITPLISLTKIKKLTINNSFIGDISLLVNMKDLKNLILFNNRISDLSPLEKLTNLRKLTLENNHISDLRPLANLKELNYLCLDYNHISDIGPLEKLVDLKEVVLSGNNISNLSPLAKLTNIQKLNLINNHISDITFLEKLKGLKELVLMKNDIVDIRPLKKLTALQELVLIENQIFDLNPLEKLNNLHSLFLGDNQISDISFLKELTNLKRLDLQNNQISNIKPLYNLMKSGINIVNEEWITGIYLKNNPLSNPPVAIVEKGQEAVLEWFELIKEGVEPLFESKIMILGQGGAGKTTLANLLNDDNYTVKEGKEESTLGIVIHKDRKFSHTKIESQKIKAHLWDFGGQDIQKMLHQFFITENCLYILVHDKRRENTNFDYWFQIINLLGSKSSVIVLENPKDMDSSNRDFPLTKYKELFPELNIHRHEVNLQNIKNKDYTKWKLFQEDIEKELSELEIVNRFIPKKWTLLRNELGKLSEKYISKDEFYKICTRSEIKLSKTHGDLCLYYLNALGDLVYYDENNLSNRIYLDHNWLTKGLYYILSDSKIKTNGGKFTRKEAYENWEKYGYKEDEKQMLLSLLLKNKFDICYELNDSGTYITPVLLPSDKPEKWDKETNLHFRYQYAFMPHGMFSRLIVRIHEKIDGTKRWETGVRLINKVSSNYAEVQQTLNTTTGQKLIDIKLSGEKEGCKELLSEIRKEIKNLHKDFMNISFTEDVACNCEACKKRIKEGKDPSFFDYRKLQDKVKNRRFLEECSNAGYMGINIGSILSDVILENSSEDNLDASILWHLREMGMSIYQINQNINSNNNVGNSSASSISTSSSKAEAINNISIEIQNILGETEMLKEDIEDERKLLEKYMSNDEIDLTLKEVGRLEASISEIETAKKEDKEPSPKSKNRFKRFFEDLSNEESNIHKTLKCLRKGKDYGVSLAEMYNKMAQNLGLPSVPPIALEVIKKL